MKHFITSSKGNHCGSQPRPVNADTFPWTYGHPEKKFNVSTEAGASFTKEAVQRVKTGGPVVQYGLCHRDFKGTVVLMSSSLPVLTLPLHSPLLQPRYCRCTTLLFLRQLSKRWSRQTQTSMLKMNITQPTLLWGVMTMTSSTSPQGQEGDHTCPWYQDLTETILY